MLSILIFIFGQQEVTNIEDGGEEICHYLYFVKKYSFVWSLWVTMDVGSHFMLLEFTF